MNSQYNDPSAENCNQSFEQMSIPVIGSTASTNIWTREGNYFDSLEQSPFPGQVGRSVDAAQPVQSLLAPQNRDVINVQFPGTLAEMKRFESEYQAEHGASNLQSSNIDVSAHAVATAQLPSLTFPKNSKDCNSVNVEQSSLKEMKESTGEGSEDEEEGETYWVPKVLWPQEMNELHARVKELKRRCRKKKDGQLFAELKTARGKFKYWYRRTRKSMQELPDFEELKKISRAEKETLLKEKMERKNEEEKNRLQKLAGSPLLPGPPFLRGPPPLLVNPPQIPGPPLRAGPSQMTHSQHITGPPERRGQWHMRGSQQNRGPRPLRGSSHMSRAPQGSMRMPYANRSSYRRQFPERHDSGWSPNIDDQNMMGPSRPYNEHYPYDSPRQFNQGQVYRDPSDDRW